jgi:citrate synthase
VREVDQRGFDNQGLAAAYLTGGEAARFLGVKRETLYAYASRGLLRSEPAGGAGRARRYLREDLERLKARHDARSGHAAVAAGALRWGEPVLESALTAIDARGPRYRGHAAVALAASSSFEAVAELLWTGVLPAAPPAWDRPGLGLRSAALRALLPAGAPPLTALSLAVPALAAADPDRAAAAPAEELRRARALVRRLAALAGAGEDPARARAAVAEPTVARALLAALGVRPTARAAAAMDRALVLCADHELNASTFAARVAASAGADLHACVSAGMAAFSGPRHGAMVERVEALVAEVGHPGRARAAVEERARDGKEIPGFGHPLYPDGDPRVPPLLEAAQSLAPQRPALAVIAAVVAAMRAAGRAPPTLDLGLAAIRAALALPPGSGTAIFAVGRTAGWIAHALEQRGMGFLLRPRARYVGP